MSCLLLLPVSVLLFFYHHQFVEAMRNVRIDKVLQRIGGFGRWQRVQLAILAPVGIFVCWSNLVYVFVASGSRSSCGDRFSSNDSMPDAGNRTDGSPIDFTTVSEWRLICTRRWLRAVQQISYSLGAALGVTVVSFVSNRLGRKRPLVLIAIISSVVGAVTPYSHFYVLFCVLRFISGFSAGGIRICALLLSLETANSRFHEWILSVWGFVHAVGYMLLVPIASVSEDWRIIYLVASVPVVVLVVYAWLIPESPRWLLMRRRKADAERILRKIASTNGHILRHESVQYLTISEREVITYNAYTLSNLTKDCGMCLWLGELLVCWFLTSTAYYSFSYSIPNIDPDRLFESHAWSGFVELLSITVGFVAASFLPRRRVGAVAAAACGLLCFVTAAFGGGGDDGTHHVPLIILSLSAKFLLVIYWYILQLLTLELFPKEIRFNILTITACVSELAAGGGSLIAVTAELIPFLPFVIAGGLASALFGLSFLLPETFRRNLDESENEHSISTIDQNVDPLIRSDSASVEMIDLRNVRTTIEEEARE